MQDKVDSQLSYALEEWPPSGRTLLFGLQWAAMSWPDAWASSGRSSLFCLPMCRARFPSS